MRSLHHKACEVQVLNFLAFAALFVGSGFLSQKDLYVLGAIHTAICVLLYLVVGTPWLWLVTR